MDKRSFLKSLGLGMAAIPFAGSSDALAMAAQVRPLLKGKVLKAGDTIGIITPASALGDEDAITLTKEVLTYFGFKVKEGKYIRERYGNLAGTDAQRLEDLHTMFADKSVAGILCIRGGAGASRLLSKIDYQLIANNPKVLLGYSDITALIMAFQAKVGLVTFHGPVGTSNWSNFVAKTFNDQFIDNKLVTFSNPDKKGDNIVQYKDRITTINPGVVEGKLLGGNLTLISGLCGSPYLPDFKDSILFLEEINETPEKVDRMFCQLMNAGILSQIKGFVFGKCTGCSPSAGYGSLNLDQILRDFIKPLNIPAYTGAVIGHIDDQFLLPVGVKVRLDATKGTIEILEKALI
ncbi:S66 peptidase family protein [Sphingobacterium hotanense]|uniref:LD-carboxypeptidase n=1 Tax=Sphingobacterium hotanense TaxID=649196 RepID=A0ABT7NKM7_9SPHI|nr:LD-carboxypeptidase [Sphingobacterium hotanense]MDM1047786.1 LD-carboxypeptidase [Sphingobacterium hotanense]